MPRRKLPLRYPEFLAEAKILGLSCPEGRASYAINRLYNGWPLQDVLGNQVPPGDLMGRAKLDTAKRWLAHWKSGGSLQSLTRNGAPNRSKG